MLAENLFQHAEHYYRILSAATAQNDQMQRELELAERIQSAVMRRTLNCDFLAQSLLYMPFRKVSGDIIDISTVNNVVRFFVGDAMGHGASAALLTMMLPLLFDSHQNDPAPSNTLREVNRALMSRSMDFKSISGIFSTIDESGRLRTCNAGHPEALLLRKNGQHQALQSELNPMLGMIEVDKFADEVIQLERGDRIFYFTDGIYEYENPDKSYRTKENLMQDLKSIYNHDSLDIIKSLESKILTLKSKDIIKDDITFMIIEFKGR